MSRINFIGVIFEGTEPKDEVIVSVMDAIRHMCNAHKDSMRVVTLNETEILDAVKKSALVDAQAAYINHLLKDKDPRVPLQIAIVKQTDLDLNSAQKSVISDIAGSMPEYMKDDRVPLDIQAAYIRHLVGSNDNAHVILLKLDDREKNLAEEYVLSRHPFPKLEKVLGEYQRLYGEKKTKRARGL